MVACQNLLLIRNILRIVVFIHFVSVAHNKLSSLTSLVSYSHKLVRNVKIDNSCFDQFQSPSAGSWKFTITMFLFSLYLLDSIDHCLRKTLSWTSTTVPGVCSTALTYFGKVSTLIGPAHTEAIFGKQYSSLQFQHVNTIWNILWLRLIQEMIPKKYTYHQVLAFPNW